MTTLLVSITERRVIKMKVNKLFKLALTAMVSAFFVGFVSTSTVKAQPKVTWTAEDGHKLKDDWLYKWGSLYYFDQNGNRVTNASKKIEGTTYYFNNDGVMVKNDFNTRNGATYYYDNNGAQVSDYFYTNWGNTYYFGKDGKRYTNQFFSRWGATYYFGSDGARYTNQFYENWGQKYYFGSDGALVTNRDITINGVAYHANQDGCLSKINYGRSYGGDYSRYQAHLKNNTGQDSFAFSQIGGSVNGSIYTQATYGTHAAEAKQRGYRFHTYIWDQTGSNQWQTKAMLDYLLTRIQGNYGSIVALDYEAGASGNIEANTDNIIYGMQMIKNAGFTPMLYSYRPYLLAHVDVQRVLQAFPNSIWIAGYQNGLNPFPQYGSFPTLDGVALWQYSDYGGQQDLNVDLTGITWNGYK